MDFLFSIFVFIFGLLIGSFLNCLAWRLYKEEGITGRSYCPHCRTQIAWYDNIPILSYLLLKGRCRKCGKKISIQYPLVEFITGILFLMAYHLNPILVFGLSKPALSFIVPYIGYLSLFRSMILISTMILIFIMDLKWFLIFDIVTLPSALLMLVLNLSLGYDWHNLIISGIIGAGFFFIQFAISKGKWIGGGDIRLGLLMGFSLGWPCVLIAILLAYFAGSIVGLGLIIAKKKEWGSEIPLGVFLAPAVLAVLFYGQAIADWYLGIFFRL